MKTYQKKYQEALERRDDRNRRSPEEQISLLMKRPGSKKKELARLSLKVQAETPRKRSKKVIA